MDTAVRRLHVNLIALLDSQYQVRMMEKRDNKERRLLIDKLRKGYNDRTLVLNPIVAKSIESLQEMVAVRSSDSTAATVSNSLLGEPGFYASSIECNKNCRFPDTKGWTWPVTMLK